MTTPGNRLARTALAGAVYLLLAAVVAFALPGPAVTEAAQDLGHADDHDHHHSNDHD